MKHANLPARLARKLVKTSKADTSLAFLLATLILGAGGIAFTSWGVWAADESRGRAFAPLLADIAYACLTFLSPADVFIHANTLPWQLEIGRNCALALTLLGVIKLLQRLSGPFVARVLMRTMASGHAIITSTDGAADGIAMATSRGGLPAALADPTLAKDDERMEQLARAGVIVVRGDSVTDMVLRGARMKQAASIAVWNTADTSSLGTALELRAQAPTTFSEIAVRIASPLVQQALRAAPQLLQRTDARPARLRPISQIGSSCRAALGGPELVERCIHDGQNQVTGVLIGAGVGLQWVADLLLRQCWSHGLGGPYVEICGPAEEWQEWLRARRALLSNAEKIFAPDLTPRIMMRDSTDDPCIEVGDTATAVFVDLGDDQRSLTHAFELATRARSEGWKLTVRALLREQSALADFIDAAELPFDPPIVYEQAASLPVLLERGLDEEAARIHLAYMQGTAPSSIGVIDWGELNETMLHANRSAANHLPIKRADVTRLGENAGPAIEELGRIEHARWSMDKLLDGWQHGERDDIRLRHPNLVPWHALDGETREKDLVEYRNILAERTRAEPT